MAGLFWPASLMTESDMKKVFRILLWVLLFFIGSSVLAVAIYRFVPVKVTPLMVIRAISPVGDAGHGWSHTWVPLDEMSTWMPKAVVASEDNRFYTHHGFDTIEIKRAIEEHKRGKRQRGASTISQQTAKNVFLWPGHSWLRKGLEAYFTVLIELMWPKDRIMEVYLNSIEMGPGIYGAEAAARHYFDRPALDLSKRQCALIAVCLPNPIKRDPAHPTSYLRGRATKISRYM